MNPHPLLGIRWKIWNNLIQLIELKCFKKKYKEKHEYNWCVLTLQQPFALVISDLLMVTWNGEMGYDTGPVASSEMLEMLFYKPSQGPNFGVV